MGTESLLFLPKMQEFSSFLEVTFHLEVEASLKVGFPHGVIWVGTFSDLDMPLDGRISCPGQIDPCRFLFLSDLSEEDPVPCAQGAKVFLLYPSGTFSWMSSPRPLPQGLKDGTVDAAEGLFAHHMPVIPGPSPNDSVELTDQVSGGGLFVVLDDSSDFLQESLDVLLRRLDEQFAVVLAYILAQKVEAVFDVRDDRLFGGEFKPSLLHEGFYQRFDLIFEQLFRDTCNDEVVRKSHKIDLGIVAVLWFRILLIQYAL